MPGDARRFTCVRPCAKHAVRQQTEIAAAGARPVAAECPHGGHGDFPQRAAVGAERHARRIGHAVQIVPDRIDAGTVVRSLHPPARRTPTDCARRSRRWRRDSRAPRRRRCPRAAAACGRRRRERRRILGIGAGMVVAVAGKLMAGGDDAADHRLVAFGDPAEREECGRGRRRRRTARGCDRHWPRRAAPMRVPLGAVDAAGERLDLEIILDIHRHRVADSGALRHASSSIGHRAQQIQQAAEHAILAWPRSRSSASIRRTRLSSLDADAACGIVGSSPAAARQGRRQGPGSARWPSSPPSGR